MDTLRTRLAMSSVTTIPFSEGDMINKEWIEYHVQKCDVVVPLVAIATPGRYVKDPVPQFFHWILRPISEIVRKVVNDKKRLVHPSTSGSVRLSAGRWEFDEHDNQPRHGTGSPPAVDLRIKSKQMPDRVIWAYGEQHGLIFRSPTLQFPLFHSKLDDINDPEEGAVPVSSPNSSTTLSRANPSSC